MGSFTKRCRNLVMLPAIVVALTFSVFVAWLGAQLLGATGSWASFNATREADEQEQIGNVGESGVRHGHDKNVRVVLVAQQESR